MIAIEYLQKAGKNKNYATILAIKDYDKMKDIISVTPDKIKDAYDSMSSPKSPNLSGMPGGGYNPSATQDKIISQLDRIDSLKKRYDKAITYMSWFEPAWARLSNDEKLIVKEFYMSGNLRSGATYRLMEALHYSQRNVDRKRKKAIEHLAYMLIAE